MRQSKPIGPMPVGQLAEYMGQVSGDKGAMWTERIKGNRRKVIVLDDDPTGTQTVHDITVYTRWDSAVIRDCFREEKPLVYLLTNSRALTEAQTYRLHRQIAKTVAEAARELGQDFILVSRSDSTLRGHYPVETAALREGIEEQLGISYDGEIICPFFQEGKRYTIGNVHYVQEGDWLVPAGQTEFAEDKDFSYENSHLGAWCEEKTKGAFKRDEMFYIPNEWLSKGMNQMVEELLSQVSGFQKVIVNAVSQRDMICFAAALLAVLDQGRHFMIRSAASLPKALGGVTDRPLLSRKELVEGDNPNGGMVVVGSHVKKTTEQVTALMESGMDLQVVEFNQHLVLEPQKLKEEIARAIRQADQAIQGGRDVLIYTRRQKLELPRQESKARAQLASKISDALTRVVQGLGQKPRFIVAKGGITSSDICTKGLGVVKAQVMGQIAPGVPVWKTGEGSKFPGMPYVIFPGNVGERTLLRDVVGLLVGEGQK